MTQFRPIDLAGFNHSPVEECLVARPERMKDLHHAVRDESVSSLLARGLGRAYGDSALNAASGVVLTERLDRVLSFDESSGVLRAEAGVSIATIIEAFLGRGWFPAVTPGTHYITLGGAIAADVHGKNHHVHGSFAGCVRSLRLLTADGTVLECSREQNQDAFFATLGGMGLTGIILDAEIALRAVESGYCMVEYQHAENFDAALKLFDSELGQSEYSVAWIDGLARGGSLGRCVVMGGRHATKDELPQEHRADPLHPRLKNRKTMPIFMPSATLNPLSVGLFNKLYYRTQPQGTRVRTYDSFFYPLDGLLEWQRIYGRRGFQQYQIVVPFENARASLIAMLERISKSRMASFLAVLKVLGPESGGLLSFPKPGWTLALDFPHNAGLESLFADLDEIALAHDGRRYLAKDANLSRDAFVQMYPNASKFMEIRQQLDPGARFASSLGRRLGLVEPGS